MRALSQLALLYSSFQIMFDPADHVPAITEALSKQGSGTKATKMPLLMLQMEMPCLASESPTQLRQV
jgi:hypothetical protein